MPSNHEYCSTLVLNLEQIIKLWLFQARMFETAILALMLFATCLFGGQVFLTGVIVCSVLHFQISKFAEYEQNLKCKLSVLKVAQDLPQQMREYEWRQIDNEMFFRFWFLYSIAKSQTNKRFTLQFTNIEINPIARWWANQNKLL